MSLVVLLGFFTAAAIALLTWALTQEASKALQPVTVFRLIESLIPGGVILLAVVWLVLFGAVAVTAVLDSEQSVLVPATGLAIAIATYIYIDWWTRAVALPTRGGISPNEAALWFAGGLGIFGIAGGLLLIAVLINLARRLASRNTAT